MSFLRNTWYCAGWSHTLTDTPLAITILNEPIVIYRKQNAELAALEDRCPHRFAPLSLGKINGDQITCGYHGLVFASDGSCTHNPHGDGTIPKACRVKSYPVTESQGAIWVWMGDAEKADTAMIADIGEVDGRAGWTAVHGYLNVGAHYELVADNLMDLSHVPYLHSFLSSEGELPAGFKEVRELKIDGQAVWSMHWNYNCASSPLHKLLWEDAPAVGTMRAHMRWTPPSVLYLDTGLSPSDGEAADGVCVPSIHLLTPASEHETHYFWAMARNMKLDNDDISAGMIFQVSNAFETEDEPMVEACASRMASTDLMSLKPVLLAGDAPAVRIRRELSKLIQQENT